MQPVETLRQLVIANYERWKGEPTLVRTPPDIPEFLSPRFGVIGYEGAIYTTYATIGASAYVVPGTEGGHPNFGGVRYEYLMHGVPQYEAEICDCLLQIAVYPFLEKHPYQAGCIVPIGGAIVPDSEMTWMYLTYPYLDDSAIYTKQPYGQIETEQYLIQTLWCLPLYRTEVELLQQIGVDEFENCLYERHKQQYDGYDFFRQPLQ